MSESSDNAAAPPKHYFVDEAGDPVLFDAKGRIIIGSEGCSRYFAVGLLDVPDPATLTADLERLRTEYVGRSVFQGCSVHAGVSAQNRALRSCEGRSA